MLVPNQLSQAPGSPSPHPKTVEKKETNNEKHWKRKTKNSKFQVLIYLEYVYIYIWLYMYIFFLFIFYFWWFVQSVCFCWWICLRWCVFSCFLKINFLCSRWPHKLLSTKWLWVLRDGSCHWLRGLLRWHPQLQGGAPQWRLLVYKP